MEYSFVEIGGLINSCKKTIEDIDKFSKLTEEEKDFCIQANNYMIQVLEQIEPIKMFWPSEYAEKD